MFSKKMTALVAGALLVATSSAAVHATPLAGAALMQSGGEEAAGSGGTSTAATLGVGFALIMGAILVADSGGNDEPVSP